MKRENHRSFLLLLFLFAASPEFEIRHGDVVAFQFADGPIKMLLWPLDHGVRPGTSASTSRASPLWLDLQSSVQADRSDGQ